MFSSSVLSIPGHTSFHSIYMNGSLENIIELREVQKNIELFDSSAVVFFMRDLEEIAPPIMQEFEDICKEYKKKSWKIVFAEVPENIMVLFNEYVMDKNFDIYETLREAVEGLDLE